MSKISKCQTCGGNTVEPAFPGDGAYPVAPMCTCRQASPRVERRHEYNCDCDGCVTDRWDPFNAHSTRNR